jgi:hypothetical protein
MGAAGAAIVLIGTGSFFVGAGNGFTAALSRSVADEFTTAGALITEEDSLATAGSAAGLASAGGAAGVLAFGLDSRYYFVAEILMSATLSFCISAKPKEVSTRNESFSNPTIVPLIFVPSFRRISSARTAAALINDASRTRKGIARPLITPSMARLASLSKPLKAEGFRYVNEPRKRAVVAPATLLCVTRSRRDAGATKLRTISRSYHSRF